MSITVVGVFDSFSDAQKACNELEKAGLDKQSMKLTGDQANTNTAKSKDETNSDDKPGAISRFFSDLFGSGDSENASHYSEAVRRGNAVLTVQLADEARLDEISDILDDCGAVDVDQRVESWKASGYAPVVGASALSAGNTDDEVLNVMQEDLEIGKRTVQKGGVRIHRSIVETPVEEQVTLRDERAVIARNKVDRPATEAEMQSAFADKDIEIRETTEEPVVSKRARVIEEVSIGKKVSERTETIRDTVRKTDVDIEDIADHVPATRTARAGGARGSSLNDYSGTERRFNRNPSFSGPERRAVM